jgi:hypothetical protein
MFGIDLRPILSGLLGGVDLSAIPAELAPAVVLAVLVMTGIKWLDKRYIGQSIKPFYGIVTFVVSLLAGAVGVLLNGGNPIAAVGTVFGVYPLAVTLWAAYEAVKKPIAARAGG